MRLLQILFVLLLALYGACWFATVPEIHRRQTNGAIVSSSSEETRPVQGEGMSYGTLRSVAYAIAPFYYHGEVSTRFGPQDGYPERHKYIGFGTTLWALDDDPHEVPAPEGE